MGLGSSLQLPIHFIRRSYPCSKESGSLCRASSRREECYDCSRFGSHAHINKASKEHIRTRSSVWEPRRLMMTSFELLSSSSWENQNSMVRLPLISVVRKI